MNIAFFKGVLIFALWSRAKENPKVSNDLKKECKRLFGILSRYQAFISVPDKKDILESIEQDLSSPESGLCTDNRLKDSNVLSYLESTLKDTSQDGLREFIKTTLTFLMQDHQISAAEKESLYLFGGRLNMPHNEIDTAIRGAIQTVDVEKAVITNESVKTKKDKIFSMSLVAVGLFMILLTGNGVFNYLSLSKDAPDLDLGKYVEQNPRLVFQKTTFNKYIAYGTPPDANTHLAKLYVYYIRGSADFQFNLKNLEIDKDKTDRFSKHLSLIYRSPGESQLPMEIDVNISQKDIFKIEEVTPQPLSESEAAAIAKAVAVPAGITGAVIGGKIGGMFKMPYVGNVISGAAGAAAGGGAAASGAYVMTKRFCTGLQLAKNSLGEQEQILAAAKPIIAMELIGGSMWDDTKWDENIRQFYQKKLNDRLKEVFGAYGWESVDIEYRSLSDNRGSNA